MATPPSIDLEDFTCSICREIFENPVCLSCSHCFCHACLNGLKKSPTSSSSDLSSVPQSQSSTPTLIYKPKIHETNQCFGCAICRKESLGYLDCLDLVADLKTLETSCPQCKQSLLICNLRKHMEQCTQTKKKINVNDIKNIFNPDFLKQLSTPQVQALEKAREGENRSTFQCPYCVTANLAVEDLCKHIEENHLYEEPQRVCPICASMPWGDKHKLSANVYQHIVSRHRFSYETYVNYDQNEDDMIAEAVERSMLYY
ncbi:unnamed protein product [Adineta steineri]|uniref:RING-type domain-containing protein n=1 Tax=Adineta steineri TaxID=433720 RepID=A0A813MJF6_9BILA|nr:unnamed protein product [Adineta steineri]CAF3518186.1 unnamed protein product [Adineta steineri]